MSIEAEAKGLMGNAAFVEALDKARAQAIASAMACDVRDHDGRRRFLDAARVVDKVQGHLNALILSAKTGDEVDPNDFYKERAKNRFLALLK